MNKLELETPALLVDLPRMESNLQKMAQFFTGTPAKLRPHFKNHKCPALAARQLAAGAIGMTCATLHEAECLVHHHVGSILLANEVTDPAKIRRLGELAQQAEVLVCVDNEKVVADFPLALGQARNRLGILVDVDVAAHRCGAAPGRPAVDIARSVVRHGLSLRGLMGYEGGSIRKLPSPQREQEATAAMRALVETACQVQREGLPVEIVSAGGTGTYAISGGFPGVTEIQAGSYLLMDTDYRNCCRDFEPTLTVLTSVVSKTPEDRIVVDAGLKSLSCEHGNPTVKDILGLTIRKLTAEHGIIELQDPAAPVEVGDKIEFWVHYSDATVNLHERMWGIRNGSVEEVFQVEG